MDTKVFFVSLLGLLLGVVWCFILGMLWYGPLWGKKWLKLNGWTLADLLKDRKPIMMLGSTFVAALMTYVVGVLQNITSFGSIWLNLLLGLFLWIGLISTTFYNLMIYEKMKMGLYLIHTGYYLLSLTGISIILTYFK